MSRTAKSGHLSSIISRLGDANYYRLRGYWLTLEKDNRFEEGTSFDDIWEIYLLDSEIRKWLWDATELIELKLRSQFAQHIAFTAGALGHEDPDIFKNEPAHAASMKNYHRERQRAFRDGVPFVTHGMEKYGDLPVWAAVEVMTLGTLSQLYGNLSNSLAYDGGPSVRSAIAASFGLKSYYLQSWLRHLTYVRNLCGHHNSVYNRIMTVRPTLLREDVRFSGPKQFPTFLVLKQIYVRSWPQRWDEMLESLVCDFDSHPSVDLSPMGFPTNWEELLSR